MHKLRLNLVVAFVATLILGAAYLFSGSAHAGALTDYLENKGIDWLMRAQAFTPPASPAYALSTGTCSDSGAPVEPSGNGYTRITYAASLANWAGTQAAASTTASSGTGGTTSNNAAITWSASTGAWGTLQSVWQMDSATVGAGNALWCITLTSSLNVSGSGFTVSFPAASLQLQIDN